MKTVIRLLAVCALTACAHHGGGGDDTTNATLSIDPPSRELLVTNEVAAHATFTATLTLPDNTTRDVTDQTAFFIDPNYGGFNKNELVIGIGGKVQVVATYTDKSGDKMATAEVIARVVSVRVDPSLPPNTADMFGGTEDAALAPQIVYPPADVVMPRNLGDFEIHWTDAHANNVFEVSLKTGYTDVRVYVPGGNGVMEAGPTPSWSAFKAEEWLKAVSMEKTVTFQVRGVNTAAPGKVGAAAPQTVQLTNEQMLGGLYYWASASASSVIGIFRHDMSKPGEPAEEYLTTNQINAPPPDNCVACHVLSRDGTTMAITYTGGGAPATMVDVGTTTVAPSKAAWDFGTFTRDSKQFISVEDGDLVVRDPATQNELARLATSATTPVSQPDLSPDGTQLVYATNPTNSHDYDFPGGQIGIRTYDQATKTFGPERLLVNDGANNYYPSWSPDGQWILFNKDSTVNPIDGTYDNRNATVWVVKADGSQPPVHLALSDQAVGLTNSWARWAPFMQTLGDAAEPMYWITMSSKRDFGVRLHNTGLFQRPLDGTPAKTAQIWMTPFFPDRAAAKQDPSAPAFRLPFQNLDSSNHIAQWTERVVVIQ